MRDATRQRPCIWHPPQNATVLRSCIHEYSQDTTLRWHRQVRLKPETSLNSNQKLIANHDNLQYFNDLTLGIHISQAAHLVKYFLSVYLRYHPSVQPCQFMSGYRDITIYVSEWQIDFPASSTQVDMFIIWLLFPRPGSLALLTVTKEKGLRNFHFDKVSETSSEIL